MSLSRLNHWLPQSQAHPEVVQGTAEFYHQIADAFLSQADEVFDEATTLDTAVDILDPPPVVESLISQFLSEPGDGAPKQPSGVGVMGNRGTGRRWFTCLVVATLYTFGLRRGVGLETMSEFFTRLRLERYIVSADFLFQGIFLCSRRWDNIEHNISRHPTQRSLP